MIATFVDLLCARGYRPFEISNVLYRAVEAPAAIHADGIRVRVVGADEAQLWSDINARGWTHEHPEFEGFVRESGVLVAAREGSPSAVRRTRGEC